MHSIHFLPWIGKSYSLGINRKRVMALGESHYCGKPEDDIPQITNDVIARYLNPGEEVEGWMKTYTKFIRSLSGDLEMRREDSAPWWNRIIFYNFVQVPMSGPRVSPTPQEFRASDNAFFNILEQYRPDAILAWGRRLYENLPAKGYQGPNLLLPCGDTKETWIYPLSDGHKVHVLPIIPHPSAAYATDYWAEAIHYFINGI